MPTWSSLGIVPIVNHEDRFREGDPLEVPDGITLMVVVERSAIDPRKRVHPTWVHRRQSGTESRDCLVDGELSKRSVGFEAIGIVELIQGGVAGERRMFG